MESGTYYLIAPEGNFKWDLTVSRIQATEAVKNALMDRATFRVRQIMDLHHLTEDEFGLANLTVVSASEIKGTPTIVTWTAEVFKLHLRTHHRLFEGIHMPNFGTQQDPILDLLWVVPPGMSLRFAVDMVSLPDSYQLGKQWLFAVDDQKVTYRLPLPNTYADCHLCHGLNQDQFGTSLEAFLKACQQLQLSEWNADLPPNMENAQRMFRWKPTETGFDQLPLALRAEGEDWRHLCVKVGVEHLTEVL